MTPPVVLSIAGTDPGGAAGLAADLATFAALGVHGACVVTAVTAQDTTGVHAIHPVPIEVVEQQLDAVLSDLDPAVVKTGMLGTADVVRLVADRCADRVLVVDPVLVATSGAVLAGDDVVQAYRQHLLPVATVATPNADEAAVLDGHLRTWVRTDRDGDLLHRPGQDALALVHDVVDTANDHGTGCTYASALAAHLAHGDDLEQAARKAAGFVVQQLRTGSTWDLGRGRGPVAHVHATHPGGNP